jgi:NAD(P)-dependent dehydrogenase (short-subunit alcohol dehydrogenase family)
MTTQSDRCAIVTGAANGLGAGIVHRLIADGWSVVATDIDAGLKSRFDDTCGRLTCEVLDIASDDTPELLVRSAMSSFGRIDALVNNAGIAGPDADVDTVDFTAVAHTFDVNLFAVIRLCAASIPYLKEHRSGSIVNIGSVFAQRPVAGGSAYVMSKLALHGLAQCLALELGRSGIAVNTVAPGYMMTRMHEEEVGRQAQAVGISVPDRMQQLRDEVPLGRHGSADDVAGAVAWLLSQDSSYVTGQTINVNGGILVS